MPGYLLHAAAVVSCAHQGQATPTAPDARVKVMGQPVVTQAAPHTIAGCAFTLPSSNPQPCLTANWTTGATRVKAGQRPVLLQDSQATCNPNGTPVTVVSTQPRVKGI